MKYSFFISGTWLTGLSEHVTAAHTPRLHLRANLDVNRSALSH